MLLPLTCEVLVYCAGEEQYDYDGGGDPHGAVQVRVALEHVEEVGARVQRRGAAAQDFGGVDVEGLRVEGERPEVVFAGGGGGGGGWEEAGCGGGGLDLCAGGGRGGEVWVRVREGLDGWGGYVLELWNSRSSCRSVWPRSPCGVSVGVCEDESEWTHFLVDIDDNVVASVGHVGQDVGQRCCELGA